jgi:hypothetical protein
MRGMSNSGTPLTPNERSSRGKKAYRVALSAFFVAALVIACGARTGLPGGEPIAIGEDAAMDATLDSNVNDATSDTNAFDAKLDSPFDSPKDAPLDSPILFEGGLLDVQTDCPSTTYCVDGDPQYVYKCGVRVEQCSSLEICSMGACKNPCADTLGEDTSNGCEFYAVEMDTTPEVQGVCFAVFVVNQWKTGEPARIQVDQNGTIFPIEQFARIPTGTGTNITYAPYSEDQGLAQNQVAILFLSRDPAALQDPNDTDPRVLANCPDGVTPAIQGDASLHGTGTGTSFHIKSNVPIVAYQMLPYGAGRARVTGATLLLPTNVWDTNYVAANAFSAPSMIVEDRAGPTMAILAQNDNTHVTINPTADILAGGNLSGTSEDVPITYTLNHGQYLQFTQNDELTGSAIQSDSPIAVIGGATLMDVPLDTVRADSAEQMLPPVQALGNRYVAVRYRSRSAPIEESVPWRVVGTVDGTVLTYDPAPPPGAPTTLNARQMVQFNAPGPFVISSQGATNPFYFAGYMTGGQNFDGIGDPEFVNVITPDQFLPHYTFFTDPTYPETNLVVVRGREPTTGLFPDANLDCAGTLTGWAPVDMNDNFEFTRIDLSRFDFQGQNGCDNGVHQIDAVMTGMDASALSPTIGLTIWGWGNDVTFPTDNGTTDEANPKFTRWVSYAYPAGADIKKLNSVVLPAH